MWALMPRPLPLGGLAAAMRESDGMVERKENPSRDFLLLLILFVAFRLGAVLFFPARRLHSRLQRSDLLSKSGKLAGLRLLLPYRDYWSEYPPLFAWLTVGIDRIARLIPVWDDPRLWFAAIFGLLTVAAETFTFVALYRLAQRLYGEAALRVAWLYAGLFLPVYLLGGWYDALPVATIIGALALLISGAGGRAAACRAADRPGRRAEAGAPGTAGGGAAGPESLAGSPDHLGRCAGGHSRRLCHRVSQRSRHDDGLRPLAGGSVRVEHAVRVG